MVEDIEQTRIRLANFYYGLNEELYELLRVIGYGDFPRFQSDKLASGVAW